MPLRITLAHHRSQQELSIVFPDRVESWHASEVDDKGGLREPKIQEGYQALTACQDSRFRVASKCIERVMERLRCDVVELRRFHFA
jgi:hypothetical protein